MNVDPKTSSCGGGGGSSSADEAGGSIGEKYDLELERRVRKWLFTVLSESDGDDDDDQARSASLRELLHDGSLLCRVVNKICPEIVPRIHSSSLPFKQMENISSFLQACERLGFPQTNLFVTLDLFEGKDMMKVLKTLNILSVYHQKHGTVALSSLTTTSDAPLRYSRRRLSSLPPPRSASFTSASASPASPSPSLASSVTSSPLLSRSTLAPSSSPLAIATVTKNTIHNTNNNTSPASLSASYNSNHLSLSSSASKLPSVTSLTEDIATKAEFKYSAELERIACHWLESTLQRDLSQPSFIQCLKSGVVLCELVNTIKPGIISKKIHASQIQYHQMENIESYLNACRELGLRESDLFNTTDLSEEKDPGLVINNIIVLGNKVRTFDFYNGPQIQKSHSAKSLWSQSLVMTEFSVDAYEEPYETLEPREKELVDWVNHQLSKFISSESSPLRPITNITSSLRSGVVLMHLLQVLTGQTADMFEPEPKYLWQYIRNASTVLNFLESQTFETVPDCTGPDIVNGNKQKLVSLLEYIRDKFDLDYLFMKLLSQEMKQKELQSDEEFEIRQQLRELEAQEMQIRQKELELLALQKEQQREEAELQLQKQQSVRSSVLINSPELSRRGVKALKIENVTMASAEFRNAVSVISVDDTSSPHSFFRKNYSSSIEEQADSGSHLQHFRFDDVAKRKSVIAQHAGSLVTSANAIRTNTTPLLSERREAITPTVIEKKYAPTSNDACLTQTLNAVSSSSTSSAETQQCAGPNALQMEKARTAVRERVVSEILSTEKSYVQSLQTVVQQLIDPLMDGQYKTILAKEEIYSIFLNMPQILDGHRRFLQQLSDRISQWGPSSTLGDFFLKETGFLKDYSSFMRGYNTSIISLRRICQKKPAFKAIKEEFEKQQLKTTSLSLSSFLIMPIQRIPRYSLLLRELLKYTSPNHDDYNQLERAANHLSDLLDNLNKGIDDDAMQRARTIHAIEDSIDDVPYSLYHPARSYVREGILSFKSDKTKYYCFMFNDMLLFCTKKSKKRMREDAASGQQQQFVYFLSLCLRDVKEIVVEDTDKSSSCLALVPKEETEEEKHREGGREEEGTPGGMAKAKQWMLVLQGKPQEREAWLEDLRQFVG